MCKKVAKLGVHDPWSICQEWSVALWFKVINTFFFILESDNINHK